MNGATRTTSSVVLAATLAGCAIEDVVARRVQSDEPCRDAAAECAPTACDSPPLLPIGDSPCTGGDGARFVYGLCVCTDFVSAYPLDVAAVTGNGSMGANGSVNATGGISISGSLSVAGPDGLTTGQDADAVFGADLEVQGVLSGGGRVDIEGDATIGGNIGVGSLRVGGTLTQEQGATLSVNGTEDIGNRATAAVSIRPPCTCDGPARVDIASAVAERRSDNNNPAIGLGAFDLEGIGEPMVLKLPCGRYHVSEIRGVGPLTLLADGRVSLFVDGSVALDDALVVQGSAGAVLELVVEQTFRVGPGSELGTTGTPVHLLVGATEPLQLPADFQLTGALYAPTAQVVTSGTTDLVGAALVGRLQSDGPLTVTYDPELGACGGL